MVCSLFLDQIRSITDQFLFGYGLFSDLWAAISETLISIIVSLLCGYYWGIEGVICGNIVGNLIIAQIWKPLFLFRRGFKLKLAPYYKNLFFHFMSLGLSVYVSSLIINAINIPSENLFSWGINALVCVIIFGVILITILSLFTKGIRNFIWRCFNNIL